MPGGYQYSNDAMSTAKGVGKLKYCQSSQVVATLVTFEWNEFGMLWVCVRFNLEFSQVQV